MNCPIKTCLAPRYTLYMLSIFSDKSTIQEQHRLSVFYHQKCRSAGNFGSDSLCSKDNLPEFAWLHCDNLFRDCEQSYEFSGNNLEWLRSSALKTNIFSLFIKTMTICSFIFAISEDESEMKNLVGSKKCSRFLPHLRRTNDGGKEEMEGQIWPAGIFKKNYNRSDANFDQDQKKRRGWAMWKIERGGNNLCEISL